MNVYGYIETDVLQGEIRGAVVDKLDLHCGEQALAMRLDWAYLARSFAAAKKALISEMIRIDADPEIVSWANDLKAADVPIMVDLSR